MNRGLNEEDYQRILAANPEWQDEGEAAPRPTQFADMDAPIGEPAQAFAEPVGPRFVEKPDSEQYISGDQKKALKSKLYAYLADKANRRGVVTSKPYYDTAEKAFAHQERVSDANALGGLLLNAGDRAGTVLGRGPASNFGQFANDLDESRQTRIGNMRALRGMEEQSNANDLNVAQYVSGLEQRDMDRKDRKRALYEQMLRQRGRDQLDARKMAEIERVNREREANKNQLDDRRMTEIERANRAREANEARKLELPKNFNPKGQKEESGKTRLKPAEMGHLNDAQSAFKQMDYIDSMIPSIESGMGPVKGRLGGLNPYNTQAQNAQSDLKTAAQVIGKYMEGGVLRAEDEVKYQKMLPSLSDTPEVARYKASQIRKMLSEKYSDNLNALQAQGYSTEGFKQPAIKSSNQPSPSKLQQNIPSQDDISAKNPEQMSPQERKLEIERLRKAVGQ